MLGTISVVRRSPVKDRDPPSQMDRSRGLINHTDYSESVRSQHLHESVDVCVSRGGSDRKRRGWMKGKGGGGFVFLSHPACITHHLSWLPSGLEAPGFSYRCLGC